MRIAAITNSRIPSLTANSIQAMKVCQALAELGHVVRVFVPAEADRIPPHALREHYGLRITPDVGLLPSWRLLRRFDFILHALRAARKFEAEMIYTWLPQSAALGLRSGYPVVLEMHAGITGRLGPWWLRRFWNTPGRRRMTVTTRALGKVLERSTGLDLDHAAVIVAPNGVDLEPYADLPDPPRARRKLALIDRPTVGFTGHIYPGRGAELLFELAKRLPHVNFLWVGGTPELVLYWKAKLEQARLGNVAMTGFVEHRHVPLHQAAADILLMPYSRAISASSGQDIGEVINPMKMFEYMASSRAIVSADLPAIREVLNERNAVFCEPGNVDAWESAIEALLADAGRRFSLGAQARRDVEAHTWTRRASRILEGLV